MPRLPTRGGSLVPNRRETENTNPIGFDMTHRRLDVAIVADDLTGALDAAAPFAGCGLETRILLDFEQAASALETNTQVLSLTSESRHLSPPAADERVWNATRAALAGAPRVLLKKINSTLRGNIAAEIMAGLRASGLRHALIAPAVPRHGRIMRGGEVFIDGVPLRQTEIGSDALSPPPSVPLPQVLKEASKDLIVHVWPRGAAFALSVEAGIHAYVADCETEADLDAIAQFATEPLRRSPTRWSVRSCYSDSPAARANTVIGTFVRKPKDQRASSEAYSLCHRLANRGERRASGAIMRSRCRGTDNVFFGAHTRWRLDFGSQRQREYASGSINCPAKVVARAKSN